MLSWKLLMNSIVEEVLKPVKRGEVEIVHASAIHAKIRKGRTKEKLVKVTVPFLLVGSDLIMSLLCLFGLLLTLGVMSGEI